MSQSSLKRKQPTISSFFTKPSPTATTDGVPKTLPKETGLVTEKPPASSTSPVTPATPESADEDDEEDEIVRPSRKRVRSNGLVSTVTKESPDRENKDGGAPAQEPLNRPPQASRSPASSRTQQFRFQSSPAQSSEEVVNGEEEKESERREKAHRHQKFVKRLGGPDCLPSLDHGGADLDVAAESDGVDEDEPAVPLKAKNAKKAGASKLTPMERQVIDIKRKHADTVLVVEVGYKFRFFGEDARIAARELSIVCIPGKLRFDEHPSEAHLSRFASASIPVHRLHVHVKRLVSAGHKVGVVRQLETAALKAAGDNRNAPFVRKLTNIYTKGTYIDDVEGLEGLGSSAASNVSPATGYLLCMTEANAKGWGNDEKVQVGIVAVQPATGDVIYDSFEDGFMRSEIETRLLHIAPCEFLLVGDMSKATEKLVGHLSCSKMNVFGDKVRVERVGKPKTAAAESHSHVANFYAENMSSARAPDDATSSNILDMVLKLPDDVTICLSAMIKHMSEYGLEHVFELTKYFQSFSVRSHMLLNGNTLVNLEIYQNQTDRTSTGSLFWALDRTKTRFGQRLLRKWIGRPLLDRSRLEERVDAVTELLDSERTALVERLKSLLSKVKTDLEKSLIRIYYGKCGRPELIAVLQTLQMIATEFAHIKSPDDVGFTSPTLKDSVAALPQILDSVVGYLNKINLHAAKKDDKYSFFQESEETDEITEQKLAIAGVENDLSDHRKEAAATLGRKKPVDYVTVAGIEYLIVVDNSSYQQKNVPASWRKISGTKQVSRYHSPEVVQYMRQRDQHKEALAAACDKAFSAFLNEISSQYQSFRDCIQALATLDCLLSLATIATQPGYVKPTYTDETRIAVEKGRHPMVEQLSLGSYVPNDINLDSNETRGLLVTGPNMGGKSSYVRQVALIAIMGQIGSYVPAASATLGMLDAVFTRMGAFDNMLAGESTFMVELSETADILKQATPRSLVILDELGRGTSTHDGVAIAQAVLDYIMRDVRALTLFITHYQHLSGLARGFEHGELKNVHMKFTENGSDGKEITFLYEVGEGVAHRSYGLNVAHLANVPSSVLDVAHTKSAELEARVRRRKMAGIGRGVKAILGDETGKDESHGYPVTSLLNDIEQL